MTEVVWDAQARTLAARVHAPFEALRSALEAAGIDVKSDKSWAGSQLSATFDALPINDAARHLFGQTYVLTWSSDPVPRPRIVLLPRPAALAAGAEESAPAPLPEPKSEADAKATLRNLAEQGTSTEFETALDQGGERLRELAARALAMRSDLVVSRERLYRIVREDQSPAVRVAGIQALLSHGFDTTSLLALDSAASDPGTGSASASDASASGATTATTTLTSNLAGGDQALATLQGAVQDPAPEVRDAAQRALDELKARQAFFDSLDQEDRNWLFKEDVLGPLSEQLARYARQHSSGN